MPAKLKAKPVRASLTELSDLTYPPNANIHGTVFGGHILQMVDKAAAVCAMRHAGAAVVTVAMDRVEFLVPIRVGDLVIVEARVNYAGRSSMEIGVEVYSEHLTEGTRLHTNSCLVTMVAVDKSAKPIEVPALLLESKEEKQRYAAAEERRGARLRRKN
jgi:acyl-CoA hydrolase